MTDQVQTSIAYSRRKKATTKKSLTFYYMTTSILLLLMPPSINYTIAQTPQSQPDITASLEEGDQIIVTGTRRKNRTVNESVSPIDFIGSDAISNHGFTETNQILSSEVPSFNFPLPSITDGTDHVRPATLRGLAPDHTLVLINGKRRHASALLNVNGSVGRGSNTTDLNTIPTIAIQNIEVLRDGASAQYGSDAIAGVLNIKLKEARQGIHFSANYGQYITSLEDVREAVGVKQDANEQAVLDDQGNYVLERTGNSERQDGETLTLAGNIGLPLGDGFFNLSGEFRNRKSANRAGYDPRQQYANLGNGNTDPREFIFNRLNHLFGNAEVQDTTLFYNSELPLSSIELYSFGSFQKRDGESPAFYRRSKDSRNITALYPDGFLPRITSDIIDYSIAGGARGIFSDWNWDASLVYGYDKFNFGVENSLNASLGSQSQTSFNAGSLISKQFIANLDIVKEFNFSSLPNPVSTAFGVEYRKDNYRVEAGEPASYITAILRDDQGNPILDPDTGQPQPTGAGGSQSFPGFQASNAISSNRDALGIYSEIDTNLTDAWNIIAALRYENYSDFGSKLSWKLATRYEVNSILAFRATVNTGFKAPSLAQQVYKTTSTVFENGIPYEVGTFPVESIIAKSLGATPLDAETSFNLSAGLVASFDNGLNFTLDVYQINIDDRIVLTENLPEKVVVPVLEENGIRNVQRARFFINGVNTKTTGFDLVASYKLQTEQYGDFRFSAAYNYNKTEITDNVTQTGPLSKLKPEDLFSRRERLRFEEGSPKSRINFTMDWQRDKLGAVLRINRYGETLDPGTTPINDEKLSAKWLTDLEIQYRFNDQVNISAGANNLFDVYPDISPTGKRSDGSYYSVFNQIFPYSNFSPFGFYGRYVYAKLNVQF